MRGCMYSQFFKYDLVPTVFCKELGLQFILALLTFVYPVNIIHSKQKSLLLDICTLLHFKVVRLIRQSSFVMYSFMFHLGLICGNHSYLMKRKCRSVVFLNSFRSACLLDIENILYNEFFTPESHIKILDYVQLRKARYISRFSNINDFSLLCVFLCTQKLIVWLTSMESHPIKNKSHL